MSELSPSTVLVDINNDDYCVVDISDGRVYGTNLVWVPIGNFTDGAYFDLIINTLRAAEIGESQGQPLYSFDSSNKQMRPITDFNNKEVLVVDLDTGQCPTTNITLVPWPSDLAAQDKILNDADSAVKYAEQSKKIIIGLIEPAPIH